MHQSFDNVFNESYLNRKCVYVGTMNNKNFWSTFEITEKILPSKVVKNDQTGCGIQLLLLLQPILRKSR